MRLYEKKVPTLQCKLNDKETSTIILHAKDQTDRGVTNLVSYVQELCINAYKTGFTAGRKYNANT